MEKGRAEKVADLVSQIRKKQADKKGNLASKLQQNHTKKSSKLGRIQVGWLHKSASDKKYKKVKFGEGGGVRHISISEEEDVTVPILLAKARKVFFPGGTSKFGPLINMKVQLGDFSQQLLEKFLDIDGNECDFQTYLHSHGLYGNRCYVFLMTRPEAEVVEMVESSESNSSDVSQMSRNTETTSSTNKFEKPRDPCTPLSDESNIMSEEFHLYSPYELSGDLSCKSLEDVAKNALEICYERIVESSYSEVISRLNCYSRDQCWESAVIENPDIQDTNQETFEPCDFEYIPVAIEKNGKCFVRLVCSPQEGVTEESFNYIYPQTLASQDLGVILHYPTEVWGYDNKQLIIGVVICSHMSEDLYYTWMKDGQTIKEGPTFCCMAVSDPGVYNVQVKMKDSIVTSESVRVGVTTISAARSVKNDDRNIASSSGGSANSSFQPTDIALPTILVSDFTFSPTDEIGRGSFGTVYRGKWAGTDVAIKKIKVRKASLIEKSLQSEVYVHSLLRHPNIVQIMAFSTSKNTLYIISEYVHGQNLEEIIFGESNIKITYNSKLFITRQVAQAVAYLQALKPPVVHRDIKPANVIVAADGFLTKLCDMGISKLKAEQTMCVGTSIGVPGTPSYMAPECFIHREKATVESDMWSLGCTLLELLTEIECWELGEEGNDLEGIKKVMEQQEKPATLKQLPNTQVSRCLAEVLVKCFDYNPAGRPKVTDIIAAT